MENSDPTGTSILVVDDTPDNVRLLMKILTDNGFKVRPTTSGEQALATMRREKPDMVLLDVMMPGMNGYTVCSTMNADPDLSDIPVIFLSALDDKEAKVKAFGSGGVDYISKPFQEEVVLARVRTHMHIQDMRRRLQEKNSRLEEEIRLREKVESALQELNRELSLLNDFQINLQKCKSEEETYSLAAAKCRELFPNSSGELLFLDDEKVFKTVGLWGQGKPEMRIPAEELHLTELKKTTGESWRISIPEDELEEIFISPDGVRSYIPILYGPVIFGVLHITVQEKMESEIGNAKKVLIQDFLKMYALAIRNFRLIERLRKEAVHDPLTGLYNRRHMEAALKRVSNLAARRKTEVGVIMLDVDHFKKFNDNHGHDAGDAVLKKVGETLSSSIRVEDIACRYGGEEFVIILPNIDRQAAAERAELLLEKIRTSVVETGGKSLKVTSSAGVCIFPGGSDYLEGIRCADKALYRAKKNGRDRMEMAN